MSLLLRTDVTSVKLYEDLILAGIGSFLCTFNRQTGKPIQKIKALNGQKIYGISPSKCNSKLLIFGGKQFTVFNETQSTFSCQVEALVCDDWVHSGIWLSYKKVALLSAHNVVMIWDVTTKSLLTQHINRDNCILYSGLLLPLQHDMLVFSGTVFSQVILQWCGQEEPLHYLKGHKGVIFSITCSLEKGIIVTTSDDRSVRIWSVSSTCSDYNTKTYWENTNIDCIHDLYGHTARVMRNCLTNNCIISMGEDSAICYWDYNGKLLRKNISHQNSSIWSSDVDDNNLVTGGGDCGIMLHPTLVTDYSHNEVIHTNVTPKKVIFTARRNIIIVRYDNILNYYDTNLKEIYQMKLNHTSTYQLTSVSSCKQIVAVVDMNGQLDVFIENCKGEATLNKLIDTKLDLGKILSMHWTGNRHLVFCSEGGFITVVASNGNSTEILAKYILPPCKERWLTSSALSSTRDVLVVGDRCGSIHLYHAGHKHPHVTKKSVHGRYGATTIYIRNDIVTTTGRDGTIKSFSLNDLKDTSCTSLEFQWVDKFLDVDGRYVCGFRERNFVVCDVPNNVKVLDVPCGGGHRPWDAVRYINRDNERVGEYIKLMYHKNYNIHISIFCLNKIVSRNIVNGTHAKEINCLKSYRSEDSSVTWYITGGEDTTLRVSRTDEETELKDEVVYRHLSNVRSLRILSLSEDKVLVLSAGGRAQICVKQITFNTNENNNVSSRELVNYQIKGTDRERKGNKCWRDRSVDVDPETRVMDVEVLAVDDHNIIIYAACSDGVIRVFGYETREPRFEMTQQVNYHKTCILKVKIFRFQNREVLITSTTRGEVAFWKIRRGAGTTDTIDDEPGYVLKTGGSGINSVDVQDIERDRCLVAAGGDDNAVHLNVIQVSEGEEWRVVDSLKADRFHCSQITGLRLVGGRCVTAALDQRITVFEWELSERGIDVRFVDQKYSDVADIHGMDVLQCTRDCLRVGVYGRGIEVIEFVSKQFTKGPQSETSV